MKVNWIRLGCAASSWIMLFTIAFNPPPDVPIDVLRIAGVIGIFFSILITSLAFDVNKEG